MLELGLSHRGTLFNMLGFKVKDMNIRGLVKYIQVNI